MDILPIFALPKLPSKTLIDSSVVRFPHVQIATNHCIDLYTVRKQWDFVLQYTLREQILGRLGMVYVKL